LALESGARLGPYEIVSAIGAGGMGEVYRALDTRLDRTVAIKVLSPQLSGAAEFRDRFDREARVISQLDHPHICALYDVGEVPHPQSGSPDARSLAFLVMQYLSGETLASRLTRGALPIDDVLRFATQIADALDAAHRRGVIHRDLKPANVMLTKDGTKLLDFGLAKSRSTAEASPATAVATALTTAPGYGLTAHGTLLGTLQYMAPEQVEGKEADVRSDVFAFGSLVYEMATGNVAFTGASQTGVMAAIVGHQPPAVSTKRRDSPPLLDHLVDTCLRKDPDARWQSMADVAIQLKLIAAVGSAAVTTPSRSSRSALVAWAAAGAAFAIAAVLAVIIATRANTPDNARFTFDVEGPSQASVGAPLQFALSPDGAHLVSVVGSDRGSVLWLRALETQAAQTLPGTEGAANPFWSPDSRFIAFFADGKLKTVDLFGSPAQSVCDAPRSAGGTWNRDGVIVFSPNRGSLLQVPATGGAPVAVTKLDESRSEIAHRFPSFLPDGRRFLYLAVSNKSDDSGVYVGSLTSAERTRILSAGTKALFAPPNRLLFMRDDTLMVQQLDPDRLALVGDPAPIADPVGANVQNSAGGFTVSDTGVLAYRSRDARNRQLTMFDRAGAQLGSFGSVGFHRNPAVSPDFTRVAVQDGATNDIWIFDRPRGTSLRFTVDRATENAPVWSPDGRRVVFASNRSGTFDLYAKSIDGGAQDQLLFQSDRAKTPEDWSADGRVVLFRDQGVATNSDLWVIPIEGARTPRPVLNTPFEEREGRLSPDGRWIAYVSNEAGALEVFVSTFPAPGARRQISSGGGHQPRWRADGKELFFLSETRDVMAVPISTSADGSLNAGTPQLLFVTSAASFAERNSWDVAPDGQRFLVNSVPIQRAPITVVVNWLRRQD
jgi:serine/threonine protein kinase/Tol biopolymer transport system component